MAVESAASLRAGAEGERPGPEGLFSSSGRYAGVKRPKSSLSLSWPFSFALRASCLLSAALAGWLVGVVVGEACPGGFKVGEG